MKREEILSRLGFRVGNYKKKRVILITDIKAEADDPYAIVHHLLSPSEEVRGIVACHFEYKYHAVEQLQKFAGTSAQQSFDEGKKILNLMEIDDVPLAKGAQYPLIYSDAKVWKKVPSKEEVPESDGADLIIREALKEDPMPLYVCCLGAMTDLAIALIREPEIASRMTVVAIAGAPYPAGGQEPNIQEDVLAAQIVFDSNAALWQLPSNVYGKTLISLAEVVDKVRPCGKIGEYLCSEMLALNDFYGQIPFRMAWPHGETWSIGDNPTAIVLLQPEMDICWHTEKAPHIANDMTYVKNPEGKEIRVYDSIDERFGVGDLLSKLHLCYG